MYVAQGRPLKALRHSLASLSSIYPKPSTLRSSPCLSLTPSFILLFLALLSVSTSPYTSYLLRQNAPFAPHAAQTAASTTGQYHLPHHCTVTRDGQACYTTFLLH